MKDEIKKNASCSFVKKCFGGEELGGVVHCAHLVWLLEEQKRQREPDMENGKEIDTLIIGAGPAGLSAARMLLSRNVPFLLVDSGDSLQNRDRFVLF